MIFSLVDAGLEGTSSGEAEETEAATEGRKASRCLCRRLDGRLDGDVFFDALKVFFASPRERGPRIGQLCSFRNGGGSE